MIQVNCPTEIYVDRALQWAADLDAYLKEHGRVKGPLHGLPVSLKDQIPIKGLETTMGTCSQSTVSWNSLDVFIHVRRICGLGGEIR